MRRQVEKKPGGEVVSREKPGGVVDSNEIPGGEVISCEKPGGEGVSREKSDEVFSREEPDKIQGSQQRINAEWTRKFPDPSKKLVLQL